MKTILLKILVIIGLVAIILPLSKTQAADNITPSAKRSYMTDASYGDVAENPKKFDKSKGRICLKVIYLGYGKSRDMKPPYNQLIPGSYLHLLVGNEKPHLPLVVPNNDKLQTFVEDLEKDQIITVYSTIKYKAKKDKKVKSTTVERRYFLRIDDIDISEQKEEDLSSFNAEEFEEIKPRRLDIQYSKFIGKKVRFDLKFRDIGERIPPLLEKVQKISPATHFTLIPAEPFHKMIIIDRANENCVVPIVEAKPGERLTICGEFREMADPAVKKPKPIYYVYVYGILSDE